MRWTRFAIGALVATGALLSGCSTGDDGDDDPTTPTTESSSEPAEEPSTDDDTASEDDGDGEASAELIAWAEGFCSAVAPIENSMGGVEDIDPNDPAATEQLIASFQQLGPAFRDLLTVVEDAGPPPVENGQEVHDAMITTFGTLSDAFTAAEDELAALDPADPASLEALGPLFQDIGPEIEEASVVIQDTFTSPEMEAAIDEAPSCAEARPQLMATRVHLGSDHAGFALKQQLVEWLTANGYEAVDHGPEAFDGDDDYPPYVLAAASATAADPGSYGIVLGGSGNGEAIAANKVRGVRAALVWTDETARLAREHNDANVISLGARQYASGDAVRFVEAFLATPFSGDARHVRRLTQVADYERSGGSAVPRR